METNNKLREALESVKELARTIYSTSDKGSSHEDLAEKIVELANAALAEPVKNCNIGTSDEQLKRFLKKWESVGYGEIDERSIHMMSVFSRWAQLPYKEGGAK